MHLKYMYAVKKIYLLSVTLWLLCTALFAQHSDDFGKVEYLTVTEGLSDRIVYDILIDSQGFMWLATGNGLNRYDGSSFLIYTNEKRNPNRINANILNQLYQWKDDHLVVEYGNKFEFIDIFSCKTGIAKKFSIQERLGLATEIFDMAVSEDKIFFLARPKGKALQIYEYDGEDLRPLFDLPNNIDPLYKSIRFLYDKGQASFWLSMDQGDLWQFDKKGNLKRQFQLPSTGDSFRFDIFYKSVFYLARDRTLWLSFEDRPGLYQIKAPYEDLVLFDKVPTDINYGDIEEDEHGNLVIIDNNADAITKSVYVLDTEGNIQDISGVKRLEKRMISFASDDFTKALYIGSYLGLHLVEQKQNKISTYFTKDLEEGEKWGNPIRGITGDKKGKVYAIYTVKNWYELDLESDELSQLIVRDSLTGEIVTLTCGGAVEEKDGYLWGYSCQDFGGRVYQINLSTKKALAYDFEQAIQGFTIASDGNLWIGLGNDRGIGGSIVELNPNKKTSNTFKTEEGYNPFNESRPIFFKETKDGTLWVGTENGLYEINRETKNVDVWKLKGGDHNVLSSNYIYVIHEAEDGRLWVGTKAGLNIINRETKEVEIYTKIDGLSNNNICGIVPANDSLYWLSTFNGLVSFDYKNKTFGLYTEEDGISHYEFNRYAFYKDYKNRIYFGGMNGFNAFRTEDLIKDTDIPKVVLTKLLKFDSNADEFEVETVGINYDDEIEIGVDISYFELDFSLPKYIRSDENQYKIFLEGYDEDWEFLGNNGHKRYTRLPAGKYRLQILGADSRGNWAKETRILNILVLEPFYKSAWFIASCILGFLLLSLGYYRLHLNNLRKQNEALEVEVLRRTETVRDQAAKLKEQDAVKSRIFAIVGHDLRKPAIAFRGITKKINYLIKKEDYERIQGLGKNLEENANALNKLTDNLLNWALTQRDVLPYNPVEINIKDMAFDIEEFFSTMLRDKGLNFENKVGSQLSVKADSNAMSTVLRNLIDNAIKYTPKGGTITINGMAKDKSISILISDTGIGIAPDKIKDIFQLKQNKSEEGTEGEKGTGLGLHLVQELMRLNKGIIEVESKIGKGTSLKLTFPRY